MKVVMGVATAMAILDEKGWPVKVTTSKRDLINIDTPSHQKVTIWPWPGCGIPHAGLVLCISILVPNISKKPISQHKHTIIEVGTELPSAFAIRGKDEREQACQNGESDELELRVCKIMTINDRKVKHGIWIDHQVNIEINEDENPKRGNWKGEIWVG